MPPQVGHGRSVRIDAFVIAERVPTRVVVVSVDVVVADMTTWGSPRDLRKTMERGHTRDGGVLENDELKMMKVQDAGRQGFKRVVGR